MNLHKRLLPYLLSFIIPAAAVFGIYGGGIWTYSAFIIAFIVIPAAELFTGTDESGVPPEDEERFKNNPLFSALLWGHALLQYAVLIVFLMKAGSVNLNAFEIIGCVLSAGVSFGGLGITVAHELIHRKSAFERFLGKAILLSTLYIHFYIEHIRGHHKNVGTEDDPASAAKGQSFYSFWIQTVFGSYLNAWKLERERLQKLGAKVFSFNNQMVRFAIYTVLFIAVTGLIFGADTLPFYFAASIIGFSLLELVNYVEHYGLSRGKKDDGRTEKVAAYHSWNSNNVLSRWFLFELTRHSDHHLYASKKYQLLESVEGGPVLPTGYPGMIILALIPPLWKKVMDPRTESVYMKISA